MKVFLWTTLFLLLEEVFQPCITTTSGILQHRSLVSEVCSNVAVEPELQQLTGEKLQGGFANRDNGARVDVAANGFWGPGRERTFLDIRVFNPYPSANKKSSLSLTYRRHENEKKSQRIKHEVELSSFTPLVFSITGGMARGATVFYKSLASMLSEKWDQHYSTTLGWLRVTLGFSLLKSAIQCI